MLGWTTVRVPSRFGSILPVLLVAAACADETGILVRIDVEQPVRADATGITVRAIDQDGETRQTIEVALDDLPYAIFFTPRSEASTRFTVVTELHDGAGAFVVSRARVDFERGQTRVLPVCLGLPCEGELCAEGGTCVEGTCIDDAVCHEPDCGPLRTYAPGEDQPSCARPLAPSHPRGAALPREADSVSFLDACTIDTTDCSGSCGGVGVRGLVLEDETVGDATQPLCVLRASDVAIGPSARLDVTGAHPFVILAGGTVTVEGILDASARGETPGPGGGLGGAPGRDGRGVGVGGGAGGRGTDPWDAGGGGAGMCGPGGRGGNCESGYNGGAGGPGVALASWLAGPLQGGSGGGAGGIRHRMDGSAYVYPNAGRGGGGGGAVQISALQIVVSGSILVTGGGGGGGAGGGNDGGGGGGAGSGGALLLEAGAVSLGDARIGALGGGGGGAATRDVSGEAGRDGSEVTMEGVCASGGAGADPAMTGSGGSALPPACVDGAPGGNFGTRTDSPNAGGGGGASGFVIVRSRRAVDPSSALLLPGDETPCVDVGRPTLAD